jgi:hypothetical protein
MAHRYDNASPGGNLRLPSCGQPGQLGIWVQKGLQRTSTVANAHLIVEMRRRASSPACVTQIAKQRPGGHALS